ncbi:YceI family protein [Lysobacter solisilvae]|uniref:YceI family protein n=1 Tax=Agrilutibacter solisilvae TaxID=2763317 RepID=A0A975AU79_9GAMM|nr:YceI family protein [Lysobacter solisilvae]
MVLPSRRARRLAWAGLTAAVCGLAPAWAQAPAPATESTTSPDPAAVPVAPTRLDPAHSRFGFELRTRWGQRVDGNFPRYEGEVIPLPDGRRRVRIRLATGSVEVAGSDRYTRFARSPSFLDAAHHPWVEFTSEPYVGELVRAGGPLRGTLSLRGVSKPETFTLKPSACPRPAHDCDVVAYGRVNRADYGLQTWRWAVQDDVRFTLRVRWLEGAP